MERQTRGMFPVVWIAAAIFCIGLVSQVRADVNGGWEQTNGPYGGEILTIYAAPKAVLFAGTEGAGIFRSTDGGYSWTPVNTGLHYEPGGGFAGVTALGQKGDTLYAGTRRTLYASTDGGNTWHRVSNFQEHESIIGIVVIGDRIYVGASDTGVWYSEDDGDSWLRVKDGFGPMALRELSSIGTTLVAGARGGVFRKRVNEDELLAAINDDFIGHQVGSFAAMEDLLYVGTIGRAELLKSNDEGDSWVPITSKEMQHTVEALSVYGATLYAGTYGSGVFRSDDNGDTWTAVNDGLTDRTVSTLLAVNEDTVFAGTAEGGIFRTMDGGDAWMEVNTGLTNTRVGVLAVIGKTIYAGVRERLVHSTNGGASWQPAKLSSMPSKYGFSALSVSEGELYTGVIGFGPRDPGGVGGGVFRLDNESNTLVQVIANNELTQIQCLEIVGTTFYIGTQRNGIYEWEKDSGPRTTNLGLKGHLITALSVKRGNAYAGTSSGEIYRSAGVVGNQWRLINPNMEVGSITGLKWVGSTLYATCLGGVEGVFRSIDGGDSWTSISDGLDGATVSTIAIDGTDIYVGTFGRGVVRWTEDKQSWKPMGSLPRRVLSLAVLDGFLYAGTLKGGVHKIQIAE